MLSVTNKPFMISLIVSNGVMVNVVAPHLQLSVEGFLLPGPNVIKLFCWLITDFHSKLECSSLARISSLV